jgi:hypothetical protein
VCEDVLIVRGGLTTGGTEKDSPNPWFGCKNRVKRSLRGP